MRYTPQEWDQLESILCEDQRKRGQIVQNSAGTLELDPIRVADFFAAMNLVEINRQKAQSKLARKKKADDILKVGLRF